MYSSLTWKNDQQCTHLARTYRRRQWHQPDRTGRHWSQTAGGCIRSTPEQSRRPPPSACSSRRCVEGRCRRCRPLDSCAPRAVRSTQLSTLRPWEHAPASLAAAATMESCAMTLRGCPSLGTRSPVQASVPGELSAAVPQRRVPMPPTLAWDQWQRPGCRQHHREVVRSPWGTRTRWSFYYVKEVVHNIMCICASVMSMRSRS